ncbi:hypothetical protein PR048_002466 [Dryococelus australis]|uniref:Flightin n=1 Tax=Dryococelus australis TaxID=614101 RepID=A0ABQ9IK93_9NEOP|nr:hypothetical protein PR048_002466 [Dryococelus australis]
MLVPQEPKRTGGDNDCPKWRIEGAWNYFAQSPNMCTGAQSYQEVLFSRLLLSVTTQHEHEMLSSSNIMTMPVAEAEMPEENPPLEGTTPAVPPVDALPELPLKRHVDPNKPIYFRYWKRPTHLQYKYLHDYRYNYYDDVIDYLDKRTRGLARDLPRPQTWAERALRTSLYPTKYYEAPYQRLKDWELLHQIRAINNYYHYHKYDYITRRYPALLL